MDRNGASHCAHLEARMTALEAALSGLTRRWEGELVPRLLAQDEEIAAQREALTDLTGAVRALADEHNNDRERRH